MMEDKEFLDLFSEKITKQREKVENKTWHVKINPPSVLKEAVRLEFLDGPLKGRCTELSSWDIFYNY